MAHPPRCWAKSIWSAANPDREYGMRHAAWSSHRPCGGLRAGGWCHGCRRDRTAATPCASRCLGAKTSGELQPVDRRMRELLARRRWRAAGLLQHRLCLSAAGHPLSQPGRSAERPLEKVIRQIAKHFARGVIPLLLLRNTVDFLRRHAFPPSRDTIRIGRFEP